MPADALFEDSNEYIARTSKGGYVAANPAAQNRGVDNQAGDPLLRRALAGDAAAFDALFSQHKDAVYACLWRLLEGDADAVEEAVGTVFLSAFRGLGRFRSESAFSTWLYRIAVNEARAHHRRKRRWRLFSAGPMREEISANAVTGSGNPAAAAIEAVEKEGLWRAVDALPEPYRTPLTLRYAAGLESAEIGEILKRPAGTVRYQLSRAIAILRERLGDELT